MSTWSAPRPGMLREEQLEYATAYLSRERRLVFMRGLIAGMEARWDQFSSVGLQDALMAFNHESTAKPITIIINSPGGSVAEGFVFYDAIKASIAPIVTVVQQAASMATVIAAAGDLRLVYEHSRSMLHLPQGGMMGDSKSLEIQQKEMEKLRDLLVETYVENGCVRTHEEILQDIDREMWMGPQETIDYGLADRIITPKEMYLGDYGNVVKRI